MYRRKLKFVAVMLLLGGPMLATLQQDEAKAREQMRPDPSHFASVPPFSMGDLFARLAQ